MILMTNIFVRKCKSFLVHRSYFPKHISLSTIFTLEGANLISVGAYRPVMFPSIFLPPTPPKGRFQNRKKWGNVTEVSFIQISIWISLKKFSILTDPWFWVLLVSWTWPTWPLGRSVGCLAPCWWAERSGVRRGPAGGWTPLEISGSSARGGGGEAGDGGVLAFW